MSISSVTRTPPQSLSGITEGFFGESTDKHQIKKSLSLWQRPKKVQDSALQHTQREMKESGPRQKFRRVSRANPQHFHTWHQRNRSISWNVYLLLWVSATSAQRQHVLFWHFLCIFKNTFCKNSQKTCYTHNSVFTLCYFLRNPSLIGGTLTCSTD